MNKHVYRSVALILLCLLVVMAVFIPACIVNNPPTTSFNTATNPPITTSATFDTRTSVPPPSSSTGYEPKEVEGEHPEDVPLYPGSILIAYIVPNEEWPPEVQNLYVVPGELDTVMEFMLGELEQEGWELIIGQQTKDGLIATKNDDLLIAIKGYESKRYPGYESEITIDWTPEWRRW